MHPQCRTDKDSQLLTEVLFKPVSKSKFSSNMDRQDVSWEIAAFVEPFSWTGKG